MDMRRPFSNRSWIQGEIIRIISTTSVVHIHGKSRKASVDIDIADGNIMDITAASPPGLQPDAPVSTYETAVMDRNIMNATRGIASDHDTTMSMKDSTATYFNIMGWKCTSYSAFIAAAFHADSIIPYIDCTAMYTYPMA